MAQTRFRGCVLEIGISPIGATTCVCPFSADEPYGFIFFMSGSKDSNAQVPT